MTDVNSQNTTGEVSNDRPNHKTSLFGPLGFLYVLTYCVMVITMGWKDWWPGFVGCIVMASWPVVWAFVGILPMLIRRGWR